MDFLCRNVMTGFKTALAERVLGNIQVADGTPAVVITLVRLRIAAILVIPAVSLGRVLFAVQMIGFVEAAGNDAESLGFVWHGKTSWANRVTD